MYRPLPIMFTVALLASTAALAEPPSRDARYQQHNQPNTGARQDHGQRPSYAPARAPERSAGWAGSYRAPRSSVREPARTQAYAPATGGWRGADRPAGNDRRVDTGNYPSRYARTDNRYPTGDRYPAGDRYRSTGWNRDHNDWHDGGGRGWDHDRDWYQHYRNDHFRYFGNRYYARQRFAIGFYEAPWGYTPRVWVYGDRLPYAYYGDRYLIDDYYDYDLYAPPYGAEWVRVGNDVLLVDIESGEVLDVVANLFW